MTAYLSHFSYKTPKQHIWKMRWSNAKMKYINLFPFSYYKILDNDKRVVYYLGEIYIDCFCHKTLKIASIMCISLKHEWDWSVLTFYALYSCKSSLCTYLCTLSISVTIFALQRWRKRVCISFLQIIHWIP